MPQLAPVFQNYLKQTSAGGSKVTSAELQQALATATVDQVKLFAKQAIDSIEDGALVAQIAGKIGPDNIPGPLNTLNGFASSKKWLAGNLDISKSSTDPQVKEATYLLQRALVKIGVHHPQGSQIATLLQLPYAADGALGGSTVAALNAAMTLAGKPELANLTEASTLGKPVADAIEKLLGQSKVLVHPATLQPPPPAGGAAKRVVFLGMNDGAPHEAKAIEAALPPGYTLKTIIDSKLGDDIIKQNGVTYDLKDQAGRDSFVNGAFQPALDAAQKAQVLSALNAGAWGIADARDEIASLALAFHEANASNGAVTIPFLYISGHSGSHDVWGDNNGALPMEALSAITKAFPKAAASVEAPFFAACNHLHKRHVTDECAKWFPNMKFAGGYCRYAPPTWAGGAAQCAAFLKAVIKKQKGQTTDPLTPELVRGELMKLKQSAGLNKNHIMFYATNKFENLATFDASTGKYYYKEETDAGFVPRADTIAVDSGLIASRLSKVQELEPAFKAMLAGTGGGVDLRDVTPTADTTAKRFYEACIALGGTSGLTDTQKDYAEKQSKLGLCARYYGKICEKFAESFGDLFTSANAQLAAIGFTGKTAAEIASPSLKRKPLLDYITALAGKVSTLQTQGKPSDKAASLLEQMRTRLRDLDQIPQTWL